MTAEKRKARPAHSAARRQRARAKTPVEVVPAVRYLESSAVVAALLEGDLSALAALRARGRLVTSAVTAAEAGRAIVRARSSGRITLDQERAAVRRLQIFERRCNVVALTEAVLARVRRPFAVEPIRTLDAVHLATAELLGEPPQLVTIVTRDNRIRDNAQVLGYRVE